MPSANGMTSAITSPLHEEVRRSVMAADVLMGADAHAAAWIGRYGEGRSEGSSATGRRRGGRAGRRTVTDSPPEGAPRS
jgi:hypothetical protein